MGQRCAAILGETLIANEGRPKVDKALVSGTLIMDTRKRLEKPVYIGPNLIGSEPRRKDQDSACVHKRNWMRELYSKRLVGRSSWYSAAPQYSAGNQTAIG
jgi:hypothetical protein